MTSELIQRLLRSAIECKHRGEYAEALWTRRELEKIYDAEPPSVEQTNNLNMMALLCVWLGKLTEAERVARRCLEIYEPLGEDRVERHATYLSMLSFVLAEAGKFDEAVPIGERALALFVVNHGEDDFVAMHRKLMQRMRGGDPPPYLSRPLFSRRVRSSGNDRTILSGNSDCTARR